VDVHPEAKVIQEPDRISRRDCLHVVSLPCNGFVCNFNHKILKIGSVCRTLFTSEDEVGGEAVVEGLNRG
jgi:hypothetical protein